MSARAETAGLLRSALFIAALGVAAKGAQLLAAIFFLQRFGTTGATDAYFLAKSLPIGVYLVFDSLLYNAVVPVYRGDDPGHTRPFVTTMLAGAAGICVVLACALFLAAPHIFSVLAPGSAPATIAQASGFCRLMTLAILALLPASLLKALNACQGRYALAALDGLLMSGAMVAAIAAGPSRWGLWPVAASLPAASLLLLAIQLAAARRELSFARPSAHSPLLRDAMALAPALIAFNALHQVNVMVMNAFISFDEAGAISWFNASYTIAQAPVSVLDLVVLSTLFPYGAALRNAGDMAAFAKAFRALSRGTLLVLVPASVWLILAREDVIRAIFERGQFGEEARQGTALCLSGVAAAMAGWGLESFAYRSLFALKLHGTYARIMACRVALNAALCVLLVGTWGALGVAMAFALSYWVGAGLSVRAVQRALGDEAVPVLSIPLAAACAGAALAGAAGHLGALWLSDSALPWVRVPVGLGAAIVAILGLYGLLYGRSKRAATRAEQENGP